MMASPRLAHAQSAAPDSAAAAADSTPASAPAQASDDAAALDMTEPDFYVVNVPTTMRLPLHKSSFRLTHRFGSNLRNGDFGDQAGNLFGLDSGAVIGLETASASRSALERTCSSSRSRTRLAPPTERWPAGEIPNRCTWVST